MIRSTTRVTTLLAVGVLALAGCSGGGDDPSPSPSQEASAPSDGGGAGSTYPTSGTGEQNADASECKADDGDQSIPKKAPTADAWPVVDGTGIPVSDTYGPTQRDGNVWTCFAHSPTGALFAASYIRPLTGSPDVRREYLSDDSAAEEGSSSSGNADLRGYKFRGYDDSSASVELVYEGSTNGSSGLVAFPVTLYWEDGKWVAHKADFETTEPETVTGMTGYTQWSVGS